MKDVLKRLASWRSESERIALATVIAVHGSAPREEGATMLITASGKIAGSVSGGCVEGAVAQEAQAVLDGAAPRIVRYGINRNMMWDVGLSCGGAIDVLVANDEPLIGVPDLALPTALCTVARGPRAVGTRRLVHASGASEGSTGDRALDERIDDIARAALAADSAKLHAIGEYEIFIAPLLPDPQLVIVGAVHIAVVLCELAAKAGYAVTVIDPRERLNNRERFPAAQRLAVGWPEDELASVRLDQNTYVAVLTHDEKFDDPTLERVLRYPVRYVGAIGSRTTQALRRKRLEAAGIASTLVDTLHGPIGLDIGAQSPQEIAVAILAEMIAVRHQRSGSKLKSSNVKHVDDENAKKEKTHALGNVHRQAQ